MYLVCRLLLPSTFLLFPYTTLFRSELNLAACLRLVPENIPEFSWASFPPDLAERLAFMRDGLVIVTGATGSGKTTTLAMVVNLINKAGDRKSTRLNSSHRCISYAVFCSPLHSSSFPTRRSSDLSSIWPPACGLCPRTFPSFHGPVFRLTWQSAWHLCATAS